MSEIPHHLPKWRNSLSLAAFLMLFVILTGWEMLWKPGIIHAETAQSHMTQTVPRGAKLTQSLMCEEIKNGSPVNQAVIFSISNQKVNCFTAFDPVPKDTFIYHSWFRKDHLSTQQKLVLKSPRWNTFSSIHLRESDIGPWRVEITASDGRILDILRFSVTE
jgi:hypothetical protein